ncbi:MAG: murein DD-endopeptidase MepM/ murein hydrolase activator NlpD [Candidatus Paceibacteria bacterium]|jgi:murein DD-endopeptidase MepM/ murein hydrolase activator NlpD
MTRHVLVAFMIGLVLPVSFSWTHDALAQSEIAELRDQINDRSSRLSDIEAEIAKFEAELQVVGAEKQTLQSAINRLETERKKVNAEISKTESLISSTDLEINKLILEITRAEDDIDSTEAAIADIIRSQYQAGEQSLVEMLLRNEKLSQFWTEIDTFDSIKNEMASKVATLDQLQTVLEERRDQSETKRSDLSTLKDQYNDQNVVLANSRTEQNQLLSATKNEEAEYQALLSTQEAAREEIRKELRDFESKLQFILDPNTIPAPGTQVFNWPLDSVIITQLFGGTEFAARNPGIYGRAYHPGVDFGAPRGTPIKAPLAGTVRAVGNTDAVPGCYSWGKWTLIDHANGLSTMYAHQDVIGVSPGQKVATGEVIGYVGNTGLSTGPHLHFTLYAKAGVSVRRFNEIKAVTGCGPATTPTAATSAYIDPMVYLPPR